VGPKVKEGVLEVSGTPSFLMRKVNYAKNYFK